MIPEFNEEGNLPEGVHLTDEDAFIGRFCISSTRRKWLCERLGEIFALAKKTKKLRRIFVWGSFVSAKEFPNDIDILLIMSDDFQIETIPEQCKILFNYPEAKIGFHADIFWSKSTIGQETLHLWLDTYQMTKDFKRRGIIEVKINDS